METAVIMIKLSIALGRMAFFGFIIYLFAQGFMWALDDPNNYQEYSQETYKTYYK